MKYYIRLDFHCAVQRHFPLNTKLKCHLPTLCHSLVKYRCHHCFIVSFYLMFKAHLSCVVYLVARRHPTV